MSGPSSSFHTHHIHSHPHKKEVPDGSQDFQKVLDTILLDELGQDKHNETNEDERISWCDERDSDCSDESTEYSDTTHGDDEDDELTNYREEYVEINNNNLSNCSKHHGCDIELCKLVHREALTSNPIHVTPHANPSGIHVFDCNGDLLYASEDDKDELTIRTSHGKSLTHFPSIDKEEGKDSRSHLERKYFPTMGTNCSTGIYDHRDWHDIIVKDGHQVDKKSRKRGKPARKKHLSLASLNKEGDCCAVTAQLCTCRQRVSDSSPDLVSEAIPIPGTDVSRVKNNSDSSLHEKSLGSFNNSPLSGSPNSLDKLAPMSRSLSPNPGGRFSRMLGLKINSASSKADVSPHRLLVRRSYSPKSRANSMEEVIRQNNDSVYRQRSCSWSNGKLSSKPAANKSGSATPLIQSPILPPVANHTGLALARHVSPSTSPRTPVGDKPKDKTSPDTNPPPHRQTQLSPRNSMTTHEQTCPLFKLSRGKEDSKDGYRLGEVDDSITPMTRRRAVSESQTFRSRQKARRAAANAASGGSQDGEHPHVHWADEGGNSSLSTSVILSSIRPRSYSHGAVANTPHRPILKKVVIS